MSVLLASVLESVAFSHVTDAALIADIAGHATLVSHTNDFYNNSFNLPSI